MNVRDEIKNWRFRIITILMKTCDAMLFGPQR
jgi:hypothetical protein